MVHQRQQQKPQPFKASALNVLTLDESEATTTATTNNNNTNVIKSNASSSSTRMPTSFQGFDIKTDPQIRRQAQKSWFDIQDDTSDAGTTPFMTASPFEGISGNIPVFPPPAAAAAEEGETKAAAEEREPTQQEAAPSPATPTKAEADVAEAPLKPGEEDADGAQAFEETMLPEPQLPVYNSQQAYYPPGYGHQQQNQPPQRSFPTQPGAFVSHHHQDQARHYQQNNYTMPPAVGGPSQNEQQFGSLLQRPANHELMGFLPFYKFDDTALNTDLPTADMIGATGRHPKLFFGHVWSRVPTGVVQWLCNSFGPSGSTAFEPQLHYNREGWFRGCLHVSVATSDVPALIYALHKRVLFDHEGVWFAETADQMRVLDDYCKRLRALPQQIRHAKLQSLPCNPLACELAVNE